MVDVRFSARGESGTRTVTDEGGAPFRLAGGGDPEVFPKRDEPPSLFRDEDARDLPRTEGLLC